MLFTKFHKAVKMMSKWLILNQRTRHFSTYGVSSAS
jgi:hypothetical protein